MKSQKVRKQSANELFAELLFHSFLRMELNAPAMSPYVYSELRERVLEQWEKVIHPNKPLLAWSDLSAGDLSPLRGHWPRWIFRLCMRRGVDGITWADVPNETIAPDHPLYTFPAQDRWAAVGSRQTVRDALEFMERFGQFQCDQGKRGSSGFADGADKRFWLGATFSERFAEVGFDNFLPWNGIDGAFHDLAHDMYDASRFKNWQQAMEISKIARGTFDGLGRGGIALQTRNAYQVLGITLDRPVGEMIFWARPEGKGNKVQGGTNTAVQIARRFNVPMFNLYKEEDRRILEDRMAPWLQSKRQQEATPLPLAA